MSFVAGFIPALNAAHSNWEPFIHDRFVRAEIATAGPAEGAVRAEATFQAPYELVKEVVLDFEHMSDWLPGLREFRVVSRSAEDAVVYVRHALPWPFKDRDYVMRFTWMEEDGRLVLTSGLVNELVPTPDDVVRLEGTRTQWTLEDKGGSTRVEYLVQRNYGDVPARLQKEAWRFEIHTVLKNLRDEVLRRRG